MSKYSKIELFTVVGYGGNNLDNQGDILFSIDAQARLNLGFHNTQKMGRQDLPEEWEEYLDYSPEVLNFLKGIIPFAAIEEGDILAFDTYKLSPWI